MHYLPQCEDLSHLLGDFFDVECINLLLTKGAVDVAEAEAQVGRAHLELSNDALDVEVMSTAESDCVVLSEVPRADSALICEAWTLIFL